MKRLLAIAVGLAFAGLLTPSANANGRLPATVNVDSYKSNFVLLPSTFGLLVSSSGGDSFEWICENNVGYGGTYDPDYSIAADGSLWATTFEGLRVSRDSGCSWETAGGNLEGHFFQDVEIGGDGRIWAGSATGGEDTNDIFVSSNDGLTFTSAGLTGPGWWRSIRVAPSDPDRIYAAGFLPPQSDGEGGMTPAEALLRVSTDGGANWTVLDASATNFTFGSQPNLFVEAVHPTNPDIVFARVLNAREPIGDDIYRSDNGGQTWTNVLSMRDFIGAFLVRSDGQTVIAGTIGNCIGDPEELDKGCVRISTDGGLTFNAPTTEPKMACIHESGDELLACGANWEPDNFALGRSTDGGQTWEKVFRFAELSGPVSCPETSPQFECAAFDWPSLCIQLGICNAGDEPIVDPPEEPKGCLGCSSAGTTLGLVFLLPWAWRRRRDR
jgi:hypothetical protein